MSGTAHFKTARHQCVLIMVLLVLVSGCHKKPSTRLDRAIWVCNFIQFFYWNPTDAIDGSITELSNPSVTRGDDSLGERMLHGHYGEFNPNSREYLEFSGLTSKFIHYDIEVYVDRDAIFTRSQSGLYTEQEMLDFKAQKKSELWEEYRDLKDTAKEAEAEFKQIEASE